MSEIIDLAYSPQDHRLRIDLRGHPTDSLEHARRIAHAVLGDEPWEFYTIDGKISSSLPSHFVMKIVAIRRLP